MAGVADVAQSAFRIALEAARQQRSDVGRHRGRQRREVRLAREDERYRVRHGLGRKQVPAGQHLEQQHAKRPDVRAFVDRSSACLLRRHVRGRPQDAARLGHHRRGHRRRVHGDKFARRIAAGFGVASVALARPKSSTLTTPSSRTITLAGLRSRWTMPASCAASRASAICLAIASA